MTSPEQSKPVSGSAPAHRYGMPRYCSAIEAASGWPPVAGGHPEAASIALQYLGIPYRWAGADPDTGFDCSGLVMYVFAQLGVQLPHFAAGQYGYGSPVARDQLQPGDLVFFDGLELVARDGQSIAV